MKSIEDKKDHAQRQQMKPAKLRAKKQTERREHCKRKQPALRRNKNQGGKNQIALANPWSEQKKNCQSDDVNNCRPLRKPSHPPNELFQPITARTGVAAELCPPCEQPLERR